MQKYFNVTGLCYPEKHYMVNLEGRLKEIKKLVDRGEYFVINRARQYGKTTTLRALSEYLQKDYIVVLISFQALSSLKFQDESTFAEAFASLFLKTVQNRKKSITGFDKQVLSELEKVVKKKTAKEEIARFSLVELFDCLSTLCETAEKPVVLMIDEVDHASNNQVFLDFLAIIRSYYLDREELATFQSVILAGVYDIKNMKLKIRPEEEHYYNSSWNIAADFNIDMSFSASDIANMLAEYERDSNTGMNIQEIADWIYEYTQGYPYMVSYICKFLDERLVGKKEFADPKVRWSKAGFLEAVNDLVTKSNLLIEDMIKKFTDYPELKQMMRNILFYGEEYPYHSLNFVIQIATMFGLIKEQNGRVMVGNRIIETRLYNLFLSEELLNSKSYKAASKDANQFIKNGFLDMELVLRKFTEHFTDVYADCEESFLEENGRRFFLLYLKPIINGVGNYYIEARTRNQRRTDVIIDYRGKQYIVEMKIWHGEEYHQRGEEQLIGYLEDYHITEGYLLSFNFNKKKTVGVREIFFSGRRIVEAVV